MFELRELRELPELEVPELELPELLEFELEVPDLFDPELWLLQELWEDLLEPLEDEGESILM